MSLTAAMPDPLIPIPDPDRIRAAIDDADERARLLRHLLRLVMRLQRRFAGADRPAAPATTDGAKRSSVATGAK